jgi:hypothetical protein|tara:strand:- start:53 stop:286 length:234 start_codon:yes stop_codon:yes gene_type:complete
VSLLREINLSQARGLSSTFLSPWGLALGVFIFSKGRKTGRKAQDLTKLQDRPQDFFTCGLVVAWYTYLVNYYERKTD